MRLIDLHVDWLLQYARETTTFDPLLYPEATANLAQAAGYLQATRAAVVACFRTAEDWAGQPDPWRALVDLIARVEAEFSGRVLIVPDDYDRWEDDPAGLTWALIGVEGFDALIREPADLERLPSLFQRGVRVFQPTYTANSLLAGSSQPGDDRGLLDLGRGFLDTLSACIPVDKGPRAVLDLAHLNPTACARVLDWFEADPARPRILIPAYSHGCPAHEGFPSPRAITMENLARLRSLGGYLGIGVTPPFFEAPEQILAVIEAVLNLPFVGRPGAEGIAIGTDFLGVSRTLPGLANAEEVLEWFAAHFDRPTAQAVVHDNARALVARLCGTRPA